MPEISRSDVKNEKWLRKYGGNRFARVGRQIFYSREFRDDHATVATKNGVESIGGAKPLVDDAGKLQVIDSKIAFASDSISCDYNGDRVEARSETNQIAKEVFGAENVY